MTDHPDIVAGLPPCPLCGGENGYTLHEGSTYRWWDVQCSNCGRIVDECASDRRTHLGTVLPERWPAADAVWSESAKYAEGMRAEITRLRAEAEALRKALIGLDEAYCRADSPLSREERHEDRMRLIAARAAIAATKGTT